MTYPLPYILYNSKFRQYKLRKKDKWYIIRTKIKSPEQLLEYIERLQPTDVYQTVSWWLNSNSLAGKHIILPAYTAYKRNKREIKEVKTEYFLNNISLGRGYLMVSLPDKREIKEVKTEYFLNSIFLGRGYLMVALPKYNRRNKKEIKEIRTEHFLNNVFLGSDYIMDFDDKDYPNGSEGSQSQLKLSKLKLNELGFKDFLTMRTGKGYQLLVMDFNAWAKKDMKAVMPRDREFQYQRKMAELTKKLLEAKIIWDYKVSTDTRRIFRVPNTLHNNGNIIRIIK